MEKNARPDGLAGLTPAADQALVDRIEEQEWAMFTVVQNEGGRASCQDDHPQFEVMRKCNLITWPLALLQSYEQDLVEAQREGLNLMAIKYARMMEITAPGVNDLPPLDSEKRALIAQISDVVIGWEEELYPQYTMLQRRGRALRQRDLDAGREEGISTTAFDTYLYGELSIQSVRTLHIYRDFVVAERDRGVNQSREVYENMVRMSGWPSLDAAEKAVREGRMASR